MVHENIVFIMQYCFLNSQTLYIILHNIGKGLELVQHRTKYIKILYLVITVVI